MAKIKRLPQKDFQYIYSRVPRLCVDLVVTTGQGVVLTRRKIPPYIGMWHTPGGTVMKGETLAEAVQRVAQDEIGVTVRIKKLIGILDILRDGNTGRHTVSVNFEVSSFSDCFKLNNQADKIKVFAKYPGNMILHQKRFLEKNFKF